MEDQYLCSRCTKIKTRSDFYERPGDKRRPVSHHCRQCAGEKHWYKKAAEVGTICSFCSLPRPIIANESCRKCLAKSGLKKCKRCGDIKLIELDFYSKKSVCIPCLKVDSNDNPKSRKVFQRKNEFSSLEKGEQTLNRYLLTNYGLDLDTYNKMVQSQNGLCAICKKPPGKGRLCVDHNHQTGQIRELLCRRCNLGIGSFNDDPALIESASFYVKKWTQ